MKSYRSTTVVLVGVASVSHVQVIVVRCLSATGAWNQSASVMSAMSHRPAGSLVSVHFSCFGQKIKIWPQLLWNCSQAFKWYHFQ